MLITFPPARMWMAVAMLALASLGCAIGGGAADTTPSQPPTLPVLPTPIPTAIPVTPTPMSEPPTPTPQAETTQEGGGGGAAPAHGDAIYETDFASGWPKYEDPVLGTINPTSSGYEFHIIVQALWHTTLTLPKDECCIEFYVELDAYPTQCPVGQAWYGMVYHFEDKEHFRMFIVTCSGKWVLYERDLANRALELGRGDISGIDTASGTHTLGLLAKSNTITVYVDNQEFGKVGVPDMPAGDIGPYAETNGAPMTVYFTRMVVYKP